MALCRLTGAGDRAVARPLISLWWPELSGVVQPLAGEWAAPGLLRRPERVI
jgi:hypothetical protein